MQKERKMTPVISLGQKILTPFIQEPSRIIANQPSSNITCPGKRKKMIKRNIIPLLVFVLSGLSIIRLLKISVITSFTSPISTALFPAYFQACSPSIPCKRNESQTETPSRFDSNATNLTVKEYQFLSNIISTKAPCNLLIFGLEQEYLDLSSSINIGGTTVILEDDPKKMKIINSKHSNTRIYKVEYDTKAEDAYKLLKHARDDQACTLHSGSLRRSSCALALTNLPKSVYKRKWDVVVVDGPRGDTPDGPGRMAVIYTARMIAQNANITDVVVHDMDRMIQKWFAWEFLCEENFISSKGKLWDFRIAGGSNATFFCDAKSIQLV